MYEKAVATLIEIPKLCPTSKFLPSAHYYLGKIYVDMKDEEKAIAEHKKALLLLYNEKEISVNKSPTTSTKIDKKIDNDWMQHIEQNIADNHIALSGVYFFRRARLVGASSTDEVQIPEESWAEIDKVLKLKPNSFKHLKQIEEFVRGVQRYRRDILEWCEKLIILQSDNGELYYIRGKYYFLLGENFQQVIKDFSKAIDYTPQDPEKYVSRGAVFVATRNYKKAIEDYNRAIILSPNSEKAYYFRGLAYFEIGNYKQSIADYDKAIEINPAGAEAYHGRGFVYLMLGNKQQAINDFKIAAKLGDKQAEYYLKSRGMHW